MGDIKEITLPQAAVVICNFLMKRLQQLIHMKSREYKQPCKMYETAFVVVFTCAKKFDKLTSVKSHMIIWMAIKFSSITVQTGTLL
jgi:hypothetical protein